MIVYFFILFLERILMLILWTSNKIAVYKDAHIAKNVGNIKHIHSLGFEVKDGTEYCWIWDGSGWWFYLEYKAAVEKFRLPSGL